MDKILKLLEIAKKFGVKPSKVIGTQGNVVPYKKPSLVDISVDEFKLKDSSVVTWLLLISVTTNPEKIITPLFLFKISIVSPIFRLDLSIEPLIFTWEIKFSVINSCVNQLLKAVDLTFVGVDVRSTANKREFVRKGIPNKYRLGY